MKRPAVTLLSGGLDSATALAIAREEGFDLFAITVDYGQRHRHEIEAARRVAEAMGVVRHVILSVDLSQFGGSGRGGYPIPWVAAVDHRGLDLESVPKNFVWSDADGDGEFDPEEFRIPKEDAGRVPSNGAFTSNLDYVFPAQLNSEGGFWSLSRQGWTGPDGDVPVWDWDTGH